MDPGEQFQLVRRLLKEQDEVLEQLDELNARIEETLRTISPGTDPANAAVMVGDPGGRTLQAA